MLPDRIELWHVAALVGAVLALAWAAWMTVLLVRVARSVREGTDASKTHLGLFEWFLSENGWGDNFRRTQLMPKPVRRTGRLDPKLFGKR